MLFSVKNITFLRAEPEGSNIDGLSVFDKGELPVLHWVPPMQRRRLSIFNRIALYAAYETGHNEGELAVVFSSRHGDLHKTSALLDTLANNESLSPTAFSMSVHNASAGLLSIFTGNHAASNTISAGRDSFFMALVDAYARISSGVCDKVLVIHCDQALPKEYLCFQDEQQIDHAVSFVMSKNGDGAVVSLDMARKKNYSDEFFDLPQALAFVDVLLNKSSAATIQGVHSDWKVEVQ